MKRHIFKALCISGAIFAGTSCLDLEPKDKLTDALAWSKASYFQVNANQFYGWTHDVTGSTWIGKVFDGPHSDLRSDLIGTTGAGNSFSNGTNTLTETDANYNEAYKRIYATNLLLDRAPKFSDQEAIKNPVGEAYFFRAFVYFELVQLFGDVTLIQRPLDLKDPEIYGPRTERTVVVDAIIADLKKAAELLPEKPLENGRVCSYTAYAMISRVGLYEGTWQKFHNGDTGKANEYLTEAVEAAEMVMENGGYELFYSPELDVDSYRYMFLLEDGIKSNPANIGKNANKEYIFARRHDPILKKIGSNPTWTAVGGTAWWPTRKLANMYRCQDGLPVFAYDAGVTVSPSFQGYATTTSEFNNRDNRMGTTLRKPGQLYWDATAEHSRNWDETDTARAHTTGAGGGTGYQNWKWGAEHLIATNGDEAYDFPVIRYAEVLLNYAEAKYELTESISNDELNLSLNLVRARINPTMTKLSNELVNTNGLSMREEIRVERTVELYHEGFRIDDLKRWKTAENEMPGNLLGIKYAGTQFATAWSAGASLPRVESGPDEGCIIYLGNRVWENKHYLLPIPNDQRQLNPNLKQNPGWEN